MAGFENANNVTTLKQLKDNHVSYTLNSKCLRAAVLFRSEE